MRVIVPLFVLLITCTLKAQTLDSYTFLSTSTSSQLSLLSSKAQYDVNYYKIKYNTVGIDGQPTIASGAVAIPVANNTQCNTFPLGAYCHGTVLIKNNVPSSDNSESLIGKLLASTGYVYALPDYLGLGDHPGLHPYLHAESEATATLDAMRAARELLDTLNQDPSFTKTFLTDSVVLTGYSQGGHAAMAAFKYIQDNNLYTEFMLTGVTPGSGPYNLSGSQAAVLVSDQPYSNPGYVFYLIMGLNQVYGNIYNDISEVFKSPYDTLIPPYFDGTYPMDSVNAKLPGKLSDFMEDSVLTAFKNDSVNKTHPIWQALLANDNYDWSPQRPLRMYYCTLDEQVDFNNSLVAQDSMRSNGAMDVAAINRGNLNHGGCVFQAILAASNFMDSVSGGCSLDNSFSLAELSALANVQLYPNPSSGMLNFSKLPDTEPIKLKITDLNGRTVYSVYLERETTLNLNYLPASIYLVTLNKNTQVKSFKWVKTE